MIYALAAPARFGWDRRTAGHAEFFTALADTGDLIAEPVLTTVPSHHGAGFEPTIGADRIADAIVINSRRRPLGYIHSGDAEQAALETESI